MTDSTSNHPGGATTGKAAVGQHSPPVTVVILTLNEAGNIAACLDSCRWCDDVHVLDSGSTDRTREIAEAHGATVHIHPFTSFGDQRNWAIDNIKARHPWQFHLDADERFTPQMVVEMQKVLGNGQHESRVTAYLVPSKLIFLDKWLRYSGGYPTYQVRLFRLGKCRFVDYGHGQREDTRGEVGSMVSPYLHFNFSKGMLDWFNKHNSYSSREAEQAMSSRSQKTSAGDLFSQDPLLRRRALKNLSYGLRGRGFFRFVYMYLMRLGWLDATPGFHYCGMMSTYEYWIELKLQELEHEWSRQTRALVPSLDKIPAQDRNLRPTDSKVHVLIPTFNEASRITEAVENALRLGPVSVLDSFSTDGTQQLARDAGATVVEHKFVNYGQQKNWGLDNMEFSGEWIFILDADERITEPLRQEILRVVSDPNSADGYLVNRLMLFMGTTIRHGGYYPSWNLRLFRRGKARYEERGVHEHMLCNGPTAYLREEMLHIRDESIWQWIAKHNKYADLEAAEWVKNNFGGGSEANARALFQDLLKYRQYIRRLVWPRLPMRPFWRFFYMYFWRFGFLDGFAGWRLARLMTTYEYTISLLYQEKKLAEERRRRMRRESPSQSRSH